MSSSRFMITALFVVFVGAPYLLGRFGGWLDGQQQGVIDQSIVREQAEDGARASERAAHRTAQTARRCESLIESPGCSAPESFHSLEGCLQQLRAAACDEFAGINLCGAVEEITVCKVPRNDAVKRGCRSLRRAADCANRPAPEKPTHNWSIAVPS